MAVRPVATSLDRFGAAQAYGCMSRAHSGHHVVLVDGDGTPVPTDEPGGIVTQTDAPTRCLGYLNVPEKDAGTGLGAWLRTHDLAMQDTDGYFWSSGRADDLSKSPGFRIGPAEIADCLIAHPAVAECPVEGKPDADRGGHRRSICPRERRGVGKRRAEGRTCRPRPHPPCRVQGPARRCVHGGIRADLLWQDQPPPSARG